MGLGKVTEQTDPLFVMVELKGQLSAVMGMSLCSGSSSRKSKSRSVAVHKALSMVRL